MFDYQPYEPIHSADAGRWCGAYFPVNKCSHHHPRSHNPRTIALAIGKCKLNVSLTSCTIQHTLTASTEPRSFLPGIVSPFIFQFELLNSAYRLPLLRAHRKPTLLASILFFCFCFSWDDGKAGHNELHLLPSHSWPVFYGLRPCP